MGVVQLLLTDSLQPHGLQHARSPYHRLPEFACPAPTPNLFSQCPFSCSLRPLGWRPPLGTPSPQHQVSAPITGHTQPLAGWCSLPPGAPRPESGLRLRVRTPSAPHAVGCTGGRRVEGRPRAAWQWRGRFQRLGSLTLVEAHSYIVSTLKQAMELPTWRRTEAS